MDILSLNGFSRVSPGKQPYSAVYNDALFTVKVKIPIVRTQCRNGCNVYFKFSAFSRYLTRGSFLFMCLANITRNMPKNSRLATAQVGLVRIRNIPRAMQ